MDVLGIIPLDYSSLNTAQEKAAIKETLKVARKLFARLGELTADPVATLAKKDVQMKLLIYSLICLLHLSLNN